MLKVLKGKMFRMIKDITDRFLITTMWRHLVEYFENHLKSHLESLYDESAQGKDVHNDKIVKWPIFEHHWPNKFCGGRSLIEFPSCFISKEYCWPRKIHIKTLFYFRLKYTLPLQPPCLQQHKGQNRLPIRKTWIQTTKRNWTKRRIVNESVAAPRYSERWSARGVSEYSFRT